MSAQDQAAVSKIFDARKRPNETKPRRFVDNRPGVVREDIRVADKVIGTVVECLVSETIRFPRKGVVEDHRLARSMVLTRADGEGLPFHAARGGSESGEKQDQNTSITMVKEPWKDSGEGAAPSVGLAAAKEAGTLFMNGV